MLTENENKEETLLESIGDGNIDDWFDESSTKEDTGGEKSGGEDKSENEKDESKEKKSESGEESEDDNSEEDDKKKSEADESDLDDKDKKDGEEEEDDKSKDDKKDGEKSDKDDDKSKDEDKSKEESGDEDEDKSDDDPLSSALGDEDEDESKSGTKSYKSIAKEVFGEDIEDDSPDSLKSLYEKKIDEAKKELDLSAYSDEAKQLIDHLNKNDGKLADFYSNDQLRDMDRFLGLDRKQMYKEVLEANLRNNEALSDEEINAELEDKMEMIEDSRLKEVTDKYINRIENARSDVIKNIVSDQEAKANEKLQTDTAAIQNEKDELKEAVENLTDYEGLKVTDAFKGKLKRQIDSGLIDDVLSENPAKIKIDTYLRLRLGDKIEGLKKSNLEKLKSESKEDGKFQERQKNHNSKPKQESISKSKEDELTDSPLEGFSDPSLYEE